MRRWRGPAAHAPEWRILAGSPVATFVQACINGNINIGSEFLGNNHTAMFRVSSGTRQDAGRYEARRSKG